MKKGTLTRIIDLIITFISAAFFAFAIAGYFLDGVAIIAASLTCGIAVSALVNLSSLKKKDDSPKIKEMITQFIYSDEEYCLNFFHEALSKKYECQIKDRYIETKSAAVFPHFTPKKISHSELAKMYAATRKYGLNKMIVLCADGFDKEASSVLQSLPDIKIEVFNAHKVYSLLSFLGFFPENKIVLKSNKASVKELIKLAVHPSRAKSYFFTSIVLIFSSFFMAYRLYYIIFGAVCLILGIVSKSGIVNKFTNAQQSADISV